MQSFLLSVVAFIIAIGVLVTIHEFGHYWVAKKMGVKVLRFSIGFGKPLWKKVAGPDQTEYVLAAIPLGGYVKMLDEREGDVNSAELDRAFNRKSVWARIAIVIAGPLANLILAVLLYWLIFIVGITGIAPIVAEPLAESPAEVAGFESEDRIVEINGKATPTWNTVYVSLLDGIVSGGSDIDITVDTIDGATVTRQLPLASELLNEEGDIVGSIGLMRWWPDVEPVIGGIVVGGAAEAAGLQTGDRILSSDGASIATWHQLVDIIRASANKTLNVVVLRDNTEMNIALTPGVRETPATALGMGFRRTGEMISVSVKMIGKLLTGQASLKNTVSGPISIAQFAGQSVSVGIDHYLSFIALVSISLGIFNLFPVPMLDGGHLLYYAIEVVTGKQVSDRIQIFGQQIGIALLGTLMIFVFYQDILRLFGDLKPWKSLIPVERLPDLGLDTVIHLSEGNCYSVTNFPLSLRSIHAFRYFLPHPMPYTDAGSIQLSRHLFHTR